jgi:hypothetical protein
MSAIFRGFTPAELGLLRHLCLRLVDNQHRLDRYPSQGGEGGPQSFPSALPKRQ